MSFEANAALIDYILKNTPEGSRIIELGSGGGTTAALGGRYDLWSVEHDPEFVGRYKSRYIYAPIRGGWYSRAALKGVLPVDAKVLIIDGPPRELRLNVIPNLDLFNLEDMTIILDDVHRDDDREILAHLINVCKKRVVHWHYRRPFKKEFAVLR